MRVCWLCGVTAFVLGLIVVIFVWPFLRDCWSGSYTRYNAGYYGNYGGYNGYSGYSGDYGGNGGYGGGYGGYGGGYGYGGGTTYAISGQPAYVTSYGRPPPCYSPCY
jgi:hypothetical protein